MVSGPPVDVIQPVSGNPVTLELPRLIHIAYMYTSDLGSRQLWYQSRTVCRKPFLLVEVESSVCENYLEDKNLFVKTE